MQNIDNLNDTINISKKDYILLKECSQSFINAFYSLLNVMLVEVGDKRYSELQLGIYGEIGKFSHNIYKDIINNIEKRVEVQ